MSGIKRKYIGLGAALLSIATLILCAMANRPPALTDGARLVTYTPFLQIPSSGKSAPEAVPYFWLSSKTLLYMGSPGHGLRLYQFDLTTGKSMLLQNLPIDFTWNVPTYTTALHLSPDRTRLLILKFAGQNTVPTIVSLFSKSGNTSPLNTLTVPFMGGFSAMQWLPDSRHVLLWRGRAHLQQGRGAVSEGYLYRERDPRNRMLYEVASAAGVTLFQVAQGVLPTGELVSYQEVYDSRGTRFERFSETRFRGLIGEKAKTRYFTTPFANAVQATPFLVSPDGKRLLWLVKPGDAWRRQLANALGAISGNMSIPLVKEWQQKLRYTPREYLYVSNTDGTNFQRIGWTGIDDIFYDPGVRWMPDSKHISFVFKGKLYIRPVP